MKKLSKNIFSILMAMSLFSTVVFAETAELMQISDITAETDEDVQYGFNRYDCYSGLDFEDGQPAYYIGNDAVIGFVKNDPVKTAHSGAGAMYGKNNAGIISVWGGPYGLNRPRIGDTISGYFYFKKLSEPTGNWQLPQIRLYSTVEGNVESSYFCVTENYYSSDVANAPLNEWIRVEIRSTGKVVTPENVNHIEYNITTMPGSCEFMIDDIVFGGYRSTVTQYSEYEYLNLDSDSIWSKWEGEGAVVEVKKNDEVYQPYEGTGAVYVNSVGDNAYYSIWGGPNGLGSSNPQAGDSCGGYFYIKKLRESSNTLPQVRFYVDENVPENYYCKTRDDITMSDIPLNEWVRIELVPTENKVSHDSQKFYYNITSDQTGDEFLIDNIVFGKVDGSYTLPNTWTNYDIDVSEDMAGETATLYDGKVFLIGGTDNNGGSIARIYDIEGNTWSNMAEPPTPVYNHTAVLAGGKIYVMGGYQQSGILSDKVQVYDIAAGTWSYGTDMEQATAQHSSVLYNNDIFITGGISQEGVTDHVYKYNIGTGLWTQCNDMPEAVSEHNSIIVKDYIYVTGGKDNSGEVNTFQRYYPLNNTWYAGNDMPAAVSGHKAIYNSEKLYVIGGGKIRILDTNNMSWDNAVTINADKTAAVFNGKIYMFDNAAVEIYDINTGALEEKETDLQILPDKAFLYGDSILLIDNTGAAIYGDITDSEQPEEPEDPDIPPEEPSSECELQITDKAIGDNIDVYLKVTTDNLVNKEFTVTYPSDKLMVTDMCKFTPQPELEAGEVTGQALNIFDITDGAFKFTVDRELPAEKFMTGIINGFSFEKISEGDAQVKCTMSESAGE